MPTYLTKGTRPAFGLDIQKLIRSADRPIGGVDVIVDDTTEAHKGNVRIAAHSEWDIAVRHAEAFGAIRDIATLA